MSKNVKVTIHHRWGGPTEDWGMQICILIILFLFFNEISESFFDYLFFFLLLLKKCGGEKTVKNKNEK